MKKKKKISRPDIRRMIARAAWNDKQWLHNFSWSEHYLQKVRGYIECLRDLGLITFSELSEYDGMITQLILKINKMI